MPHLVVSDFACIRSASLRAAPLTLIIGPQASGKSVLAKLMHFFNELITSQVESAQRDVSDAAWLEHIEQAFRSRFPPTAWGPKGFRIHYTSGPFEISINSDRRAKNRIRAAANETLLKELAFARHAFSEARAKAATSQEENSGLFPFELYWPIQEQLIKRRQELQRDDYVRTQLFIPAGRSFFTTLGKTAVALGNDAVADSLTQRFGRLITSLRDETYPLFADMRLTPTAQGILGGDVIVKSGKEFLQSPDGRQIPLNLMSSGQQEFFPLAIALNYALLMFPGLYVFIEEPEAHLFPAAQSALVDLMVDTISAVGHDLRMFITTHSPYCLSQFNNLLKAGSLAESRPDLVGKIEEVIPSDRWLYRGDVAAYGIVDGEVIDLIDDDGLIDSAYLDSISEKIADDFGHLLELEFQGG